MRIVFWARLPFGKALVVKAFRAVEGISLVVAENLAQLQAALPGADALVLYNAPVDQARQVIEILRGAGSTVRWMHFLTAGREGFDAVGLPAGIAVTYARGASAPVVAEHAMALVLALGRRLPEVKTQAENRTWDRSPGFRCSSLEGATMAVIGFGPVGQEIARRARIFGATIHAVCRSGRPDPMADVVHPVSALHHVLGLADTVMVCVPLSEATRHLLDHAAFAACKRGALLVNVARGAVVDQTALCAALHCGQLGGAGLDVTDPEPPPASDPLWACPNLLVSPHIAVEGSPATERRLAAGAVDNLHRFLAGQPLRDQVAP